MKCIPLYRVETEDKGDSYVLFPHIPDNRLMFENNYTARICACPTIIGCLYSAEIGRRLCLLEEKNNIEKLPIYIYKAYVDIEYVDIPSESDVYDAWHTGEMWITMPTEFTKVGRYTIRKHMELPYSCYSRFAVTKDGHDEIIDLTTGDVIYGEPNAFSYIDINPTRTDEALAFNGNGCNPYYNFEVTEE